MSGEYDASRSGGGTGAGNGTETGGGTKWWDDSESWEGAGEGESSGTIGWALESGALALMGGAFLVFRGLSAVVRGKRLRGIVAALAGVALVALGRSQWRNRRAAPFAEAAEEEEGTGEGRAEADADEGEPGGATDRAEVERPEAPPEPRGRPPIDDTAEPAPVGEDVDVLGAAAFDGHGLQVPVPQRALDQGYLSPGEVFWGVRLADGAVVVSDLFDPIWDDEDYHYVGSSEVAEDRTLRVPDAVLDNWDRVYQGGDAVVGGDDLTFLTTPELTERDQLRVVPEAWLESVMGEESAD